MTERASAGSNAESERTEATERRSFREGFGFGSLSFVAGAVLGAVSTVAVARLYGIQVIGEFALATAPAGVVWFLSTVRERPALVRILATLAPRDPRVTGLFAAVFAFSFALTAVVALLAGVISYFVFKGPVGEPDLFAPAVVNLAGYALLINTSTLFDTVFSSFRAGRQLFWIRLWEALGFLVLATGLSFVAESVWCLIAATAGSALLVLVYRIAGVRRWMRFRVPRNELRDGFSTLPEIIRFGLKMAPGGVAQGLSAQVGTWTLGVTSSVASVGAWNRAWMVGKRMLDLNNRLTEMLLPTLVERREGDARGFDRALLDSMRYTALGLLLPAAAVGGAASGVMEIFGPGFSRAADALAFIALVVPFTAVALLQMQGLLAADRPLLTSWLALLRLAVTLAVSIPLAIELGITGAAIGLLAGCVAQFAAQFVALRPFLSGPVSRFWPLRTTVSLVLAFGCGFVSARLVQNAIPGLAGVVPALLAGSLAYAAAAAGGFLPRDRDRLRAIVRRFKERRSRRGGVKGVGADGARVSAGTGG